MRRLDTITGLNGHEPSDVRETVKDSGMDFQENGHVGNLPPTWPAQAAVHTDV